MMIVHILIDGSDADAESMISEYEKEHDNDIVDLSQEDISYDELVYKIEQCDKVISW